MAAVKYLQAQLFILKHGLNSSSDLYYLIQNDLSMYFPNGNFRLLDFDYYLKCYCNFFFFAKCRAMNI